MIGLKHYRASGKLIQVHLKPRKLHRVFTQRYLGKLKKDPSLVKLIGMALKWVNAFFKVEKGSLELIPLPSPSVKISRPRD